MFRRNGVISRSFHTPHGVNINQQQSSKVKRKLSWSGGRVRNASSEGVLTYRPVVLKEGFLCKPSFFRRFGGRKRRWCVLRTYTQSEASIDIYLDETKTRYKGSISLDRDAKPFLIVKNADKKRKASKQCFLTLKVGKNTYQFTTDSFRELKEWCALIRQAFDCGSLFSGKITEPIDIEEGMVNVKFNSNCIALLCPIQEIPIKTWRLDHITSFGQCGGILTFECCSTCSDPSACRCSINIIQEKPATILNLMERAIRSNPNTSEIHYERSILGDIYHCGHDCTQPRLLPAYSDPNLFRSASASPIKGLTVPIDVHSFYHGAPSSTLDSSDSGLPGTPQQEESLSIASNGLPSPTGSNRSNPGSNTRQQRDRNSPFRSPKHSSHLGAPQGHYKGRSMSDSRPTNGMQAEALRLYARRQSDEPPHSPRYAAVEKRKISDSQILSQQQQQHHPRLTYAMISHDTSPKLVRKAEVKSTCSAPGSSVAYATVATNGDQQRERKSAYSSGLQPVDEKHESVIYDVPNCDFLIESNPFSPPPTPAHGRGRKDSRSSDSSHSQSPIHNISPGRTPRISVQSTASSYTPGSDLRDRTEDFEELPPVPKHRRPARQEFPTREPAVQANGFHVPRQRAPPLRRRLQSSSDILEAPRQSHSLQMARSRGSMDNLDQIGKRNRSHSHAGFNFGQDRQLRGSADLLARLHEEEENLTKVLRASRNERNEELFPLEARDELGELNRPYRFRMDDLDYDEPDPDTILETCSNLADYRSHLYSSPNLVDRVLSKVASNTVRGYAYKITIPLNNTQYDVPRTTAPAPDLSRVRPDAPPKPIRCTSTEQL